MKLLVQRRRVIPLDYAALCPKSWRNRGYGREMNCSDFIFF